MHNECDERWSLFLKKPLNGILLVIDPFISPVMKKSPSSSQGTTPTCIVVLGANFAASEAVVLLLNNGKAEHVYETSKHLVRKV
jgi:hypothetical protein